MKSKLLKGVVIILTIIGAFIAGSDRTGAKAGVAIDQTNFPDKIFREEVISGYDLDKDGLLSDTEIEKATMMGIVMQCDVKMPVVAKIKSIKGIEYLTALKSISFCGPIDDSSDNLSEFDFSHNTQLERIYISSFKVKSLKLGNLNKLKEFSYTLNTGLDTIDTSLCTNLEKVEISDCESVKFVDLTKNTKIKRLDLGFTNIQQVDLTKNTNLTYLDVFATPIKEMDVSKNINLKYFYSSENSVKLDVTKNVKLEILELNGKMKKINLTKNTKLRKLLVGTLCKIQTLNLKKNKNLEYLWMYGKKVKSLNLNYDKKLKKLSIENAQLKKLQIRKCTLLKYIRFFKAKLPKLYVNTNGKVKTTVRLNGCKIKVSKSKKTKMKLIKGKMVKVKKVKK